MTSRPVTVGCLRVALVLGTLLLGGCGIFGSDDEILEGTRIPVRTEQTATTLTTRPALVLPPATVVSEWTHKNGSPGHRGPHGTLSAGPRLAWSADAGSGASSRAVVTASPVVAGGRIFTLDAASEVRAFGPGGGELWRRFVGFEGERGEDGYGGGLAAGDGQLYVSTGFGEVLALAPETGEIVWRTRVDGPVRAAPTAYGARVFAVTRSDIAYGLDRATGEIVWRIQGAVGLTGLLGGASPAADPALAVLPFASGEVTAALGLSGRRVWTAAIAGGRRGLARTTIGDITSDPVIDGEQIYAANQSGRLVSIDRRTGNRNWTANDGSLNPVWPEGGSVFLVSDTAELLRLDAATGSRIWATQLTQYDDPDDRDGAIGYGGPVLAGGRLWIVSAEGYLLGFDPEGGQEVARVEMPDGSTLSPALADGRLYVMTAGGRLLAFQ